MSLNQTAKGFKGLHISKQPIIVPNVWDIASLQAIASLNIDAKRPVKAVATSSWAVAGSLGIKDEELTYEQSLTAVKALGHAAQSLGIALSIDLGDGYGSRIGELIRAIIEAGVVGGNIEDAIPSAGHKGSIQEALYDHSEQIDRLETVLRTAEEAGVPDFVLNARCDVFTLAPHPTLTDQVRLEEGVKRGKAYLEAGATAVYFPSLSAGGLSEAVVKTLVKELDGRVTVLHGYQSQGLSVETLAKLGVARVQFGAGFFIIARDAIKAAAARVLNGENIV